MKLQNICDDCGWVVSQYSYTYDERDFIVAETAIESLAAIPMTMQESFCQQQRQRTNTALMSIALNTI